LEAEIDASRRAAIRSRKAHADWTVRHAWDLYNPDDKRISGLSFEDRVALVVDRSGGPGSPWALIQHHYAIRTPTEGSGRIGSTSRASWASSIRSREL